MPYIHKKELNSMEDELIVNRMATAEQPHQYRREAKDRMATAKKGTFWYNVHHAGNNVGTAKKTARYGVEKCWKTDRALKEEPDFRGAIEELMEHSPEYWPPDDNQQKDLEEVQSFLETILDNDFEYAQLTPKMIGLLGVIRRAHLKWVEGE
jgi:hypothetical protein